MEHRFELTKWPRSLPSYYYLPSFLSIAKSRQNPGKAHALLFFFYFALLERVQKWLCQVSSGTCWYWPLLSDGYPIVQQLEWFMRVRKVREGAYCGSCWGLPFATREINERYLGYFFSNHLGLRVMTLLRKLSRWVSLTKVIRNVHRRLRWRRHAIGKMFRSCSWTPPYEPESDFSQLLNSKASILPYYPHPWVSSSVYNFLRPIDWDLLRMVPGMDVPVRAGCLCFWDSKDPLLYTALKNIMRGHI